MMNKFFLLNMLGLFDGSTSKTESPPPIEPDCVFVDDDDSWFIDELDHPFVDDSC